MNKELATQILDQFGNPKFKIGSNTLAFSRQTQEDINQIEAYSDDELIQNWKSLVLLNEIIGQVSLNDMQRISLIELEFNERSNINKDELTNWFENTSNQFDEQEPYSQ